MPAPRDRPHILLPGPSRTEAYSARPRKIRRRRPTIGDPETHAKRLLSRFDRAVRQSRAVADATVQALAQRQGLLIEVRGFPGFEVALESLDSRRTGGIELRAVQKRVFPDEIEIVRAVVYVPFGQVGSLRKKIENYLSGEPTLRGHRKNKNLVETIQDFDQAVLRSLWTENEPFPGENELIWWEVWLRRATAADEESAPELERFRAAAGRAGLRIRLAALLFADRVVVVTHGDPHSLATAFEQIDDLAELRRARETAAFFRTLPAAEQMEFIQDLLDRSSFPGEAAPAVCVLDTGVNRGHPLLAPALAESNVLACRGWPSHDHDGHGTEMAGLALYGDLVEVLEGSELVDLRHRLESVKILPTPEHEHPPDDDGPELWGAITAEACARAEISAPNRQRCFSMAVTAGPTDRGQPTSWSAAIDALAAGRQVTPTPEGLEVARGDREYRLFVVSSGNLPLPGPPHPDNSDSALVQDPAQAWNVLSVGAYTERAVIEEQEDYWGWRALAAPGDLSPHSTTSVDFDPSWPIKPEVMLEGGNVAVDASSSECDSGVPSLCLLSTSATPQISPLEISFGTSAACALTARLAARLAADHPEFWPETLRALVVHSARWTPAMRSAFDAVGARKRRRAALLRRYGFGVPDLARATRSAADAVTLIAQTSIRPYAERRMREMHLYQLPWPTETLLDLGEHAVRLRVTLSYFIEPNPGRRGWTKRFRYASHGLRFEIKGATEEPSDFRWRLNEQARLEDEGSSSQKPPDPGWFLGEAGQTKGSIHSDCWDGPAVELARRGLLAIYPVSGWWKELPTRDRSNEGVRYSLVVSIETDEEEVDLWTPVALQLEIPIEIS